MPVVNAEYCIICDDIRPEVGDKFTILGFYGLSPHATVTLQEWGNPIEITFLVGLGKIDGEYDISTRLLAPNKVEFVPEQTSKISFKSATGRAGLATTTPPIVFKVEGVHTFQLRLNNELVMDASFKIKKAIAK